jgi:hypothetical protein
MPTKLDLSERAVFDYFGCGNDSMTPQIEIGPRFCTASADCGSTTALSCRGSPSGTTNAARRKATDSAPTQYRPRQPSRSVLYRNVQEHPETWFSQCRDGHYDAGRGARSQLRFGSAGNTIPPAYVK